MPIQPYLTIPTAAFQPVDIRAMSIALNDVCKALKFKDGNVKAKETVAIRIIELARRGERDPIKLRDQVVAEANGAMSKFNIGDMVTYQPESAHSRNAAHGAYEVIAIMPSERGRTSYRIKSMSENYERVADETELTKV